jgi:hypothetical protein
VHENPGLRSFFNHRGRGVFLHRGNGGVVDCDIFKTGKSTYNSRLDFAGTYLYSSLSPAFVAKSPFPPCKKPPSLRGKKKAALAAALIVIIFLSKKLSILSA